MATEFDTLQIIRYPDPRLRKPAEPVEAFDGTLAALAQRMLQLMRAQKGVGLAGPQVGVPLRLFVLNVTQSPEDDLVLVNPELSDLQGIVQASEGCLSIPEVRAEIRRAARCRVSARDVAGRALELEAGGLLARVLQHETDHLNGVLILDRMGPGDRIAARKQLRELEAEFAERRAEAAR